MPTRVLVRVPISKVAIASVVSRQGQGDVQGKSNSSAKDTKVDEFGLLIYDDDTGNKAAGKKRTMLLPPIAHDDESSSLPKNKINKRCSFEGEGRTDRALEKEVCGRHEANELRELKLCTFEGCSNQPRRGGVCWRHGGRDLVKRCSSEGCTDPVRKGGVCWRHGGKELLGRCNSEGCTNWAVRKGVCRRHGAKELMKRCKSEGCRTPAMTRGVCWRHGASQYAKPKENRDWANVVHKPI
jgi:hypothetical protein